MRCVAQKYYRKESFNSLTKDARNQTKKKQKVDILNGGGGREDKDV